MRDQYKVLAEKYEIVTEAKLVFGDWGIVGLQNIGFFNKHLKEFLTQFDPKIIPFLVDYISELNDENMNACYDPNDKDPERGAEDTLFTWYIITYQQHYDFIKDSDYSIPRKTRVPENIQIEIRDKAIQTVDNTIKDYMDKFLNDKTSNTYKKWEVHLKIQAAQQQHLSTHKVDISDF